MSASELFSPKKTQNDINIIDDLKKQIRMKEAELENAEKVNKNFEKMLQLVNILGQVDNFLADRMKTMIKKLAVLADDDDYRMKRKSNQ